MVINTTNELVTLLGLVEHDATVLAAISNGEADSTASGPAAGLVTTRLGDNVKNVQKVIADMESGVSTGIRPAINAQTGTSYAIALTDNGDMITMNNASANTLTINPIATTAYPVGSLVEVIQLGAGTTTITAGTGVGLNGVTAGSGDITAQYDVVNLRHVANNVWIINGDIGTIS
jgi:hypothetical protein